MTGCFWGRISGSLGTVTSDGHVIANPGDRFEWSVGRMVIDKAKFVREKLAPVLLCPPPT
jgi:hypothetical protein